MKRQPNRHRPTHRRLTARVGRRGVILLVVMLLLSLFTLIALTMFLTSSIAYKNARATAGIENRARNFSVDLRRVSMDLLRGSKDPKSPLVGHELLNDIYGDFDFVGTLFLNPGFETGNTNVYVSLPNPPPPPGVPNQALMIFAAAGFGTDGSGNQKLLSREPNYYAGQLLTFTSGRAKNQTVRIVSYRWDPMSTNYYFTVYWTGDKFLMPSGGPNPPYVTPPKSAIPLAGDSFVINGRPFSGTGVGYDPTTTAYHGNATPGLAHTGGMLTYPVGVGNDGQPGAAGVDDNNNGTIDDDAEIGTLASDDLLGADGQPGVSGADDDGDGTTDNFSELGWYGSDDRIHLALLPAGAVLMPGDVQSTMGSLYYRRTVGSQANEDYDIPDYQNLFLAAQVFDPNLGQYRVALPSFHRPELVNFWASQTQTPTGNALTNNPFFRRRVIMRPLPVTPGVEFVDEFNPVQNNRFDFQEPYFDANRNGAYDLLPAPEAYTDWNNNGQWDRGEIDFTGKPFNPVTGPWDVDNDLDGQEDGVWLDPGYAVRTTPDGRRYKLYYSTFILDLDPRLNVNVHGDPDHYRFTGAMLPAAPEEFVTPLNNFVPGPYAGGMGTLVNVNTGTQAHMLIGAGYGPADVSLRPMLNMYAGTNLSPSASGFVNEYRQLLEGAEEIGGLFNRAAIPGRYGERYPGFFARPGVTSTYALFGVGPDGAINTADDLFSGDDNASVPVNPFVMGQQKQFQKGNFFTDGWFRYLPHGLYGSPPDLDGIGGVALDLRGQPFYSHQAYIGQDTPFTFTGGTQETVDDPYELDVFQRNSQSRYYGPDSVPGTADDPPANSTNTVQADAPFTAAELIAWLAARDPDLGALPSRLTKLAPSVTIDPSTGFQSNSPARHLLTTDSMYVPVHHAAPTPELRRLLANVASSIGKDNRVNVNLADLFEARLQNGGFTGNAFTVAAPPSLARQEATRLLSFDLQSGLQFDLNRPFGNGRDDNGNNVVDEPQEIVNAINLGNIPEPLWANPGPNGNFGDADDFLGIPSDLNGNGNGLTDLGDARARQDYAGQLFLLMMMLKDSGYVLPFIEPTLQSPPGGQPPADAHELTARRIAQWAINVAEFRDRDNIMTAFEYDQEPFDDNGWEVDGDITTDETATNPDRRVVWGCEKPELIISEDSAVHDKRLRDLATAGGGTKASGSDNDMDQFRVPQGSAFIELYAARNPNNTAYEGDLYDNSQALHLSRYDDNDNGAHPVWRIVVGQPRFVNNQQNNIIWRLRNQPDRTSLDVDDMNLLGSAFDPLTISQYVVFTTQPPPPGAFDLNRTYWNRRGTDVYLTPGQYAVVGPHRPSTVAAFENVTKIGNPATGPLGHRIELGLNASPFAKVTNNDTSPNKYPEAVYTNGSIKDAIGIPVAGDLQGASNLAWTAAAVPGAQLARGFSISEPPLHQYYQPPTDTYTDVNDNEQVYDLYGNVANPGIDTPEDGTSLVPGGLGTLSAISTTLPVTGTHLNYSAVFLQRIADPTRPWDAVNNPYRTVDWMPIDLTVFNSQEAPSATDQDNISLANVHFGTRQRGMQELAVARSFNLFKQLPWGDENDGFGGGTGAPQGYNDGPHPGTTLGQVNEHLNQATQNFGHPLNHTLGFINESYQDTTDPTDLRSWWLNNNGQPPGINQGALANLANLGTDYAPVPLRDQYIGDARRPFTWLTWSNRPFANAMELTQVPASSAARLMHEYALRTVVGGNTFLDHYASGDPETTFPLTLTNKYPLQDGHPFGHLLNFFRSASANANPTQEPNYSPGVSDWNTPNPTTASANHHRLFDLVRVPSRFSGTDEFLDPIMFGNVPGFAAPFNRLYKQREPGRVNLNTIFDDPNNAPTLQGLLNVDGSWATNNGLAGLGAKLQLSRRGYGATNFYDEMNPNIPTIFANPFRSPGQSYVVPIEILREKPGPAPIQKRSQVEASILRPDPNDPTRPLFSLQNAAAAGSLPSATDAVDTDRNAYFRYQALQKLGGTTTTHSNVFAIWVTVGYFEVQPGLVDALHPDGFYVTNELGIENGSQERHRSFMIIDRSIPVGFRRGHNLNVDRSILVERIVE